MRAVGGPDRPHLRAVAHRMLGSAIAADDVVQETWFRFTRADVAAIVNVRGWLTTVVSRLCLDVLRSPTRRREEFTADSLAPAGGRAEGGDPAGDVELADAVGAALSVVLDRLSMAIRMGAPAITRGAADVAAMFSGRALGADVARVDGRVGLAWIVEGAVKVAWNFYIDGDSVVHIDMHADPARLDVLEITAVD